MLTKSKIFENLVKNVQNLKIFWKRAGDCMQQSIYLFKYDSLDVVHHGWVPKNTFCSRLPKTILLAFFTFFLTKKHQTCIASCTKDFCKKRIVLKNCVKYSKIFKKFILKYLQLNYVEFPHHAEKDWLCFYKTQQIQLLPSSAAK